MSESARAFGLVGGGIRVAVRLTPKAARASIEGVATDADGRAWLKVRVGAPPEGGKANRALLKLLAKEWRLPASRLSITSGSKDRRKTVLIEGGDEGLLKELASKLPPLA